MVFPPMEIAAAPAAEPSSSASIAATITNNPAPPSEPRTNGNRSLSGVPPPIFNGDREHSEAFLDKFLGYELANMDAKQFTVPALKTALCLTYLNGVKIDAWARQKRKWLRDEQRGGAAPTEAYLWDHFERDFKAAFTDGDAKITASEKLHALKMVGSDIDTYIAEFDRLLDEIGYRKDDWGAILKFKEGLQPKLLHEIIVHTTPAPTTMTGWKNAARQRQTVYKELKNAGLSRGGGGGGPTDTQKRLARLLGLRGYQTPAQRTSRGGGHHRQSSSATTSQIVPMDVDAGKTTLSDTERSELLAKRACFYCKKVGHVARDCRSKQKDLGKPPGYTPTATPTPPANVEAHATSEPDKKELLEKLGGYKEILNMIKNEPADKQEEFIDLLQDF